MKEKQGVKRVGGISPAARKAREGKPLGRFLGIESYGLIPLLSPRPVDFPVQFWAHIAGVERFRVGHRGEPCGRNTRSVENGLFGLRDVFERLLDGECLGKPRQEGQGRGGGVTRCRFHGA